MAIGPMDLLWMFFIISALQPVVSQRFLEASRRRLISKIEHRRGSRVILLVHRQETMNFLGFPVLRYIDINDSEQVLRAIHMTDPNVPLDLVLHTPGGVALAALQIARAIRKHRGKVTVFVPHYAMSGGTLIALAADEIVMTDHAVLGPVDPQLDRFPAASILSAVRTKHGQQVDDETLILADQAEKSILQMRASVEALLDGRLEAEKKQRISQLLSEGTWTHDYPISLDQARDLGLQAGGNMPEEILQLMALFPQPVRRAPSVEYLDEPRQARPRDAARPRT